MLEVRLLHHGRFIDMKRERDAVVVGDFDELFDVIDVGAANIGVEENCVAVAILALLPGSRSWSARVRRPLAAQASP
jgi:hypothetical protein